MRKRKKRPIGWLSALLIEATALVAIVTVAQPMLAMSWLNRLRPIPLISGWSLESPMRPAVEKSNFEGYHDGIQRSQIDRQLE